MFSFRTSFYGSVVTQPAETGTVVGTASITNKPRGWTPDNFYLVICPADEAFSLDCNGQPNTSQPDQTSGKFSINLPAAPWKIGMYYYTAGGEMILSKSVTVVPQAGKTITQNITMAYVVPAVDGKVTLTGAPTNFDSIAYMGVQACPGTVGAFSVGCNGGQEDYDDVGPGTDYSIDVTPGTWTVGAYYRNDHNNVSFAGVPVKFTAVAGVTRKINVTIKYQGI